MANSAFTFGNLDIVAESIVDAKGDLIVGSAPDVVGRLPVPPGYGDHLSVDPAQALGMRWTSSLLRPFFLGG